MQTCQNCSSQVTKLWPHQPEFINDCGEPDKQERAESWCSSCIRDNVNRVEIELNPNGFHPNDPNAGGY